MYRVAQGDNFNHRPMLKTECTKCGTWAMLPFNTVEETACPNCGEDIPVKDVYVSAGPYTIYRDVLLKNMYKYKRLIMEAEKEISELQKKNGEKRYEVTAESIRLLLANFKEMLDGCRDSQRHNLGSNISYTINKQTYQGKIVNLSLSGICIDAGKIASVSKLFNEIMIRLKYGQEQVSLNGKIMWIGGGNKMGIKFLNIDENVREALKDYILRNWDREKALQEDVKA